MTCTWAEKNKDLVGIMMGIVATALALLAHYGIFFHEANTFSAIFATGCFATIAFGCFISAMGQALYMRGCIKIEKAS